MARAGKGLPPTLNIAGRTYTIVQKSERAKRRDAYGYCDTGNQEIHLDDEQHPECLRDTALHETLHAISTAGRLRLQERQVYVLAGQLLDMFKRNPAFTRWLLG